MSLSICCWVAAATRAFVFGDGSLWRRWLHCVCFPIRYHRWLIQNGSDPADGWGDQNRRWKWEEEEDAILLQTTSTQDHEGPLQQQSKSGRQGSAWDGVEDRSPSQGHPGEIIQNKWISEETNFITEWRLKLIEGIKSIHPSSGWVTSAMQGEISLRRQGKLRQIPRKIRCLMWYHRVNSCKRECQKSPPEPSGQWGSAASGFFEKSSREVQ